MDGSLTRAVCEKCGWSGDVVYPMLYHDMEAQVMIWLWPNPGDPETGGLPLGELMGGHRFRIVDSRVTLLEKILIFDNGLDDRVVEFVKLLLWAQSSKGASPLNPSLVFAGLGEDAEGRGAVQFEHLRDGEIETLGVPMNAYERISKSLQDILPLAEPKATQWQRVDRKYAESLARHLPNARP